MNLKGGTHQDIGNNRLMSEDEMTGPTSGVGLSEVVEFRNKQLTGRSGKVAMPRHNLKE